jgi:hypothetical protein
MMKLDNFDTVSDLITDWIKECLQNQYRLGRSDKQPKFWRIRIPLRDENGRI